MSAEGKTTVELSKKERLVLINQFEIRKALEPDISQYFDGMIELLRNGFEIFMMNW